MQLVFYIIYIYNAYGHIHFYIPFTRQSYDIFSNLKTGSLLVGRAATEALTTWLLESSGGCTRNLPNQITKIHSSLHSMGKNAKHHLKNIKSLWLTRTLSAGKLSLPGILLRTWETVCTKPETRGKNTEVVYQAGSFQRRQLEPQTSTLW